MMMGNLRAAANHVALKIIFGLIIVSFVLGGVGGYLNFGSDDHIANINGYKINRMAFDSEIQKLTTSYGYAALGEDDRVLYTRLLRTKVLNDRIDEILLTQYKEKLGIQVTNNQIKEVIIATPEFQVDGVFSNQLYHETLTKNGYSPESYAEAMRSYLGQLQLLRGIAESDFALPIDSNLSLLLNEKRGIYSAVLSTNAVFSEQTVADDELLAYYDQHKESMTEPEQIKVEYIHLTTKELIKNTKVSDNEIKAYYKAHPDEFVKKTRYKYSAIQVATEAEAKDILAQLKKKVKFTTLAAEKSMYALTRENKGSLGWFYADKDLPTELSQAKLTKKGQISGIVPFSGGYTIIRLDDLEPEKVIPLTIASSTIRSNILKDKVNEAFLELQTKVQDAVIQSNSLDEAAEIAKVTTEKSNWFSIDAVPWGFNHDEVKQAIFHSGLFDENGSTGINSNVVAVDDNEAFVFRVIEHKNAGIQSFETTKASISNKLKQQKAENFMNLKAQEILAELNKGNDKILSQYNMAFAKSSVVERNSNDFSSEFIKAVFNAPRSVDDQPVYGYNLETDNSVTFFVITDVEDGTEVTDLSQQTMNNLVKLNQQSLMAGLREQGKVDIAKDADLE